MSRSNKRLAERVTEVHEFNEEQLKQCARGLIAMILDGEIERTHAQMAMSLVMNEAANRRQQKLAK